MRTSFATISKQGARSNNEDYLLVMDRPEAKRLTGIVCDGMGGHSSGEVASLTVCNCIAHYWDSIPLCPTAQRKCWKHAVRRVPPWTTRLPKRESPKWAPHW